MREAEKAEQHCERYQQPGALQPGGERGLADAGGEDAEGGVDQGHAEYVHAAERERAAAAGFIATADRQGERDQRQDAWRERQQQAGVEEHQQDQGQRAVREGVHEGGSVRQRLSGRGRGTVEIVALEHAGPGGVEGDAEGVRRIADAGVGAALDDELG